MNSNPKGSITNFDSNDLIYCQFLRWSTWDIKLVLVSIVADELIFLNKSRVCPDDFQMNSF